MNFKDEETQLNYYVLDTDLQESLVDLEVRLAELGYIVTLQSAEAKELNIIISKPDKSN